MILCFLTDLSVRSLKDFFYFVLQVLIIHVKISGKGYAMKARIVVTTLIEKNGKILLGQKPKDVGPYPNTWHLPGGGVNLENESLEDAVRREVKEETGLEIEKMERVSFDEDYERDKRGDMTHYLFLVYKVIPKSMDAK